MIIAYTYIHIREPPGSFRSNIRKSVPFLIFITQAITKHLRNSPLGAILYTHTTHTPHTRAHSHKHSTTQVNGIESVVGMREKRLRFPKAHYFD
jgi:hypothetical protein